MAAESLERILAEHPFFGGMDEPYLQLFVDCASNVRFNAGDVIFREGDEANTFYLIRARQGGAGDIRPPARLRRHPDPR